MDVGHYNQWLTDLIQKYITNMDKRIKYLFEPYVDFSKMDCLFGLSQGYITKQRMKINKEKVIAVSILNNMKYNINQFVNYCKDLHPEFTELLSEAESDIITIINHYETKFKSKPTPDYQMYKYHPDFNRKYFSDITTVEKAYWLGFLFADGWISIEHKQSGDYYRMGLQLSRKDKIVLIRFCNAIGLNTQYIKDRETGSDFSNKKYKISEIRWGDQNFAQDLINLGMEYEYNEEKGRRIKTPRFPNLRNRKLMLAFLLGFYDGDGTLGYNVNTGKIRPRIASSEKNFLLQIKQYFRIDYQINSTEIKKFNIRTRKFVKIMGNRLFIGIDLFEEMLRVYNNSLKRKRILLDFFF